MSMTQSNVLPDPPRLNLDSYSDEILKNPLPYFKTIRETAPVVYLTPTEAYAVGRQAQALEVAKDHERFTASHGIGILDITKPGLLRPTNEMLEADPPQHTKYRTVMQSIVSPAAVRGFQGMFTERADEMVDGLLAKGRVDGVADIAEAFILSVFPEVVGIKLPHVPALAVGTMMLNLMGPVNDITKRAIAAAEPHMAWFAEAISRQSALPGGLAELTYKAEDQGLLPAGIGLNMVIAFVAGGFDSTIGGIGNTLHLLARNPDQWGKLRANPALARPAFDEGIRLDPPFRVFYRMTTRDTELGGYKLAANTKIGVWMAAINRDPNLYERPDDFDVTRKGAAAGFSFGAGAHNCLGQVLARVEAEAIISALARKVARFELDGEPEYQLHNHMRLLSKLPLRLTAA